MKNLKSYGYATRNENGNFEVRYKEYAGLIFNRNPKEKRVELTSQGWREVNGNKFSLDTVQSIVEYYALAKETEDWKKCKLNIITCDINYNEVVKYL